MKLLQMQALKEGQGGEKNIQNIYTIRYAFFLSLNNFFVCVNR